jgi:hypothetical protein
MLEAGQQRVHHPHFEEHVPLLLNDRIGRTAPTGRSGAAKFNNFIPDVRKDRSPGRWAVIFEGRREVLRAGFVASFKL